MELFVLVGLALFVLFAAAENRPPEVETFVITRPAPSPASSLISTVATLIAVGILLLIALEALTSL